MLIFEIVCPGTSIDNEDREWSLKMEQQLMFLENQFFTANSALNLFFSIRLDPPPLPTKGDWLRDCRRRTEIGKTVEREIGDIPFREKWEKINFESDVRFKREQWKNGSAPSHFELDIKLIAARAFLYALDAFEKLLGVISKEKNVPERVAFLHQNLIEYFPNLRGVRNTEQHLEDRFRRLGADKKQQIDLKPIANGFVEAPAGGILVLGNLNGTRYGSTMADGHYGEVDVSPASMTFLQKILEEIFQSFKWRGPKRHGPSV